MNSIFRLADSFLFLIAIGGALLVGCESPTDGPPLVPVEGVVTLDGQPLAGAVVTLIPKGETRGQASHGRTDATGKFTVTSSDGKRVGATVGSYQVVISKYVNPDGSDFVGSADVSPMDAGYRELLLPAYSDVQSSRLVAEVPAAGAKLEFKLLSKLR